MSGAGDPDLRGMDCTKFLHTDIKNYLETDEYVKQIRTQKVIYSNKFSGKVLQYKYNRGIKSSYGANYGASQGHQKQAIWNLDHEKRKLKVPYNPPRTFTTTYAAQMVDTKGTGMIGAMGADGSGYVRRGPPKGETEDNVKREFQNNSSYALTFPVYGSLPQPNKRPPKPFAPGYGKVVTTTSY